MQIYDKVIKERKERERERRNDTFQSFSTSSDSK